MVELDSRKSFGRSRCMLSFNRPGHNVSIRYFDNSVRCSNCIEAREKGKVGVELGQHEKLELRILRKYVRIKDGDQLRVALEEEPDDRTDCQIYRQRCLDSGRGR